MTNLQTFYLSKIIGNKVYAEPDQSLGRVSDLLVDITTLRPKVVAIQVRSGKQKELIDFSGAGLSRQGGRYLIRVPEKRTLPRPGSNELLVVKHILDKQVVDVSGRKVVRVNDLRLAVVSTGTYLLAVDVGIEGLLRRMGTDRFVRKVLNPFGGVVPSRLILWEDVEAVNFSTLGIQLAKPYTKLNTLHPSDLADILEDLDRETKMAIFASLDEERAADVLEELESEDQLDVLENLSVEKAADVLEKMPSDEAADILDDMKRDKVEELLLEMEHRASREVRELLEYSDNEVGSLMSTKYISLGQDFTVDETLQLLRRLKPEPDTMYYLYVLDQKGRLIAYVSLRDLVVSEPGVQLKQIMNQKINFVFSHDKLNTLPEIISKYNLLAIPVVDAGMKMIGTVIIDDVVDNLME